MREKTFVKSNKKLKTNPIIPSFLLFLFLFGVSANGASVWGCLVVFVLFLLVVFFNVKKVIRQNYYIILNDDFVVVHSAGTDQVKILFKDVKKMRSGYKGIVVYLLRGSCRRKIIETNFLQQKDAKAQILDRWREYHNRKGVTH